MKRCECPKQWNQYKKLEACKERGLLRKRREGRGLQGGERELKSPIIILEEILDDMF